MLEKKKSHEKGNNRYREKYSGRLFASNVKNQNGNENKQQNDFTTAEAAWMEKKQKLYKDTNNQPLWDFRKIQINPTDTDELISFPTNKIPSNKYGTYSFIFKSLYEQFLRLPNIWFLIISLLEFIPAFENLANYLYYSKHSSIYLLLFFICISIVKNLYEDSRRSNIDNQINNRLCHIVDGSSSQLKAVRWMDLTVGSIIRLIENEQVPADILLLSCNNSEGLVYIETSLLNGETNLNKKCCVNETRNETSIYGICNIKGRVICEKPNSNMESFNGSLKLDAHPRATSLSINNVVFKGSYIKNTDYIFGVIIYTGTDTKIMKNILRSTYKSGYVNKELNVYTIITIFFTLVCVFISVLCKWTEDDKYKTGTHFLLITVKDNLFESIIKYILLYANTIPISVLITVDLISLVQSVLIENDNRISTFENESSEPSVIDENEDIVDLKMNKSFNFFRKYTFLLSNFTRRNFTKNRFSSTNTEANSDNRKSFISTFDKLRNIKKYFYNKSSLINSKSQSNIVYNRSTIAESDHNEEEKNKKNSSFLGKLNNLFFKKWKHTRCEFPHSEYTKRISVPSEQKENIFERWKTCSNAKGEEGIDKMGEPNINKSSSNYRNGNNNYKGILINNSKRALRREKKNTLQKLFPFFFRKNRSPQVSNMRRKIDKSEKSSKGDLFHQKSASNDDEYGWGICLNANMHGDLGNVDFVFTDKTGTLTNNNMSFNMCSIGGRTYGKQRQMKKVKNVKGKSSNYYKKCFYHNSSLEKKLIPRDPFVRKAFDADVGKKADVGNSDLCGRRQGERETNNADEPGKEVKKRMQNSGKGSNDDGDSRSGNDCGESACDETKNESSLEEEMNSEVDKDVPSYKLSDSWNYKGNIFEGKKCNSFINRHESLQNSSTLSSSVSSSDSFTSENLNSSYMYSSSNYDNLETINGMDSTKSYSDFREKKDYYTHLRSRKKENKRNDKINDRMNHKEEYADECADECTDELLDDLPFFDKNYLTYLMKQKCSRPKNFRLNMNTGMTKVRCDFSDKRIYDDLNSNTWRGYYIDEFFRCITLCHAVVPFIQFDYIRNKNLTHFPSRSSKGVSHYFERYNNPKQFSSSDLHKAKNEMNPHVSVEYGYDEGDKIGNRQKQFCDKINNYENVDNAKSYRSKYTTNQHNINGTNRNETKRNETNLYNYISGNDETYIHKKSSERNYTSNFQLFFSKNYKRKKMSFLPCRSSEIYKGVECKDTNRWKKYLNTKKSKNYLLATKRNEKTESGHISKRLSAVSFKQISKEKLMTMNSYGSNKNKEERKCKNKCCNTSEKNFEFSSLLNEKSYIGFSDETRRKVDEKNIGYSDCELEKNKDIHMMYNYASESNMYLDAIKYQSSSLDEECLVYTSSYLGYRLILRNKNTMCIEIDGNFYKWTIIGINEFTNKRGRMSIVVKPEYMQTGSILYVKGSDTSILSLLNLKYSHFLKKKKKKKKRDKRITKMNESLDTDEMQQMNYGRDKNAGNHSLKSEHSEDGEWKDYEKRPYHRELTEGGKRNSNYGVTNMRGKESHTRSNNYKIKERYRQLEKQLRSFSVKGLRTMVFAFRYLNEEETVRYKRMYDDACLSIYNKEQRLECVAEQVETDLIYLGITGVKDRLQKKVAKTIEILNQSGVRIWMLTGDNVEYSLHISFLCKILNSHTKIFHAMLENTNCKKLKREGTALYELFQMEKEEKKPYEKLCLLINGKNLQTFLNHSDLQTHFLNMACSCDVVIACRITAKQKAFIVRLIKNRLSPSPNTLAIGDGANDIAMIQEANIGVSIMTSECIISAGYADYCIKNFSYLRNRRKYNMNILKFLPWILEAIFYGVIVFFFAYTAVKENSHLNNGEVITINTFAVLFPNIYNVVNHWLFEQYQEKNNKYKYVYFLSGKKKFLSIKKLRNKWKWKFKKNRGNVDIFQISKKHTSPSSVFRCSANSLKYGAQSWKRNGEQYGVQHGVQNGEQNGDQNGEQNEGRYKSFSKWFSKSTSSRLGENIHDMDAARSTYSVKNNNTHFDEENKEAKRNVTMSSQAVHAMENVISRKKREKKNKGKKSAKKEGDEENKCISKNHTTGKNNTAMNEGKSRYRIPREKKIQKKGGSTRINYSEKNVEEGRKAMQKEDDKKAECLENTPPDGKAKKKPRKEDYSIKKNLPKVKNGKRKDETFDVRNNVNACDSVSKDNTIVGRKQGKEEDEQDFIKSGERTVMNNTLVDYNDTIASGNENGMGGSILVDSKSDEYIEPNSRIDESLMAEMKNCLNPLKNTFLVDLLPQGKRFRINEEHIFFKNNERMENIPEPLDVNKRNYHIIQNKADFYVNESTSEFSYTSADSLSDNNDNKKKKKNENTQKEIVKVSNLINRFTLAFKDMQLESGFQIHKKNKFYKTFTPWYRFIFILLGIFFLYIWKLESSLSDIWQISSDSSTELFILILSLLLELVLLAATVTTFFPNIFIENFNKIISAVVILIITHHVVSYSITHIDGVFQAVLFPLYTFVILRLPFVNAVLCNIIFLSLFIIRFKGDHFLDKKGLAHYIPLFIGVDVFVGFVGYRLEYNQRKNFLLEYSVESSRRKQREILNTMLPSFVVDEMIYSELNEEGIPVSLKAEDIETVTIIFCDIYDFQNIVASIEPTRLVEVLDRLFLCFDKCTEQFNCTKIETVFETYLAACGLVKKEGYSDGDVRSGDGRDDRRDDIRYDRQSKGKEDAHDSIDFALSILQVSSHIKYEKTKHMLKKGDSYEHNHEDEEEKNNSANNITKGKSLESRPTRIRVKIGIHSGRIIAGVVGSKKPQYALFGDTVNTASRMKTTGKPDYIHLSEATYDLVKDDKTLIYEKKETEIKGKGTMVTYLLTSVIGLNYPFLDDHVDRKNHFLSDFYLDNNYLNENLNYDQTQNNILGYYSNKLNDNNEYTVNDTMHNDGNSYNSDNETNNDYINLKDLSLHDLPNEYIRDVNTHYYDIIKLRNLKIGTAVGHQLKQKDIINMTLLNNGLNNDSTNNFNQYLESNKEIEEIKDFDMGIKKLSLNDSLYYLSENLIKRDQENLIFQKGSNQDMGEQHNKHNLNNRAVMSKEIYDNEEDYKNVQICTRRCNSCNESYCSPNNCVNSDHVNHVAYHKMLSNIRRNYLKNLRKEGKKEGGKEEQDENCKKYTILNFSKIVSCVSKMFTHLKKKKKKKNYSNMTRKKDQEKSKRLISLNSEWIFLKFSDKNLEAKYRAHFYSNKSNINSIEQALIIFLVTFVMQTLISSTVPIIFVDHKRATQTLQVNYFAYWSVRSVYTYLGFMLWLLFHYRTRSEVSSLLNIKWMIFFLNLLFISAACVFSIAYLWAISETDQTTSYTIWMTNDTIEFFFYLVILHHNTGMLFQTCILVDLLFITMSLTFISTSVVKTITTDSTVLLIPWYVVFNLISTYCKESIDRRTFYANESAKKTENRATELLNDMLPKHVLEEFQQDKLKLAYTHDRLTFLFADICGFTSWANGVDASEVLTLLQKLFAKFDNDSTKYGLYKLCTIGDAYVAISEPVTEDNQDYDPVDGTERVLEMAYSMIRIIKEIREKLGIPNLNMRIGLHYGSCVGGVIGSGRLRYDLWGIDVLTGNLMESNGIPGKINVSETLKNFLLQQFKNRFIFKPHTTVRVIYKDVKCFIITDKKEIDSSNNSKMVHNRNYLFNRKIRRQNHLGANLFDTRKHSSFSRSVHKFSSFDKKKTSNNGLYYINVNDVESNL
ncbi:guanylyl cyclase, putative [Plasmodium ovale curtisi]|uniref:guanylate cyclase n=1 Tax=Plasmodium ovale curtisi TaxID=864141 RepID=A0A1A8WKY1_PLAOA|nr:guanylyl cyclase, putative [Plasmodium ovale curtisi]